MLNRWIGLLMAVSFLCSSEVGHAGSNEEESTPHGETGNGKRHGTSQLRQFSILEGNRYSLKRRRQRSPTSPAPTPLDGEPPSKRIFCSPASAPEEEEPRLSDSEEEEPRLENNSSTPEEEESTHSHGKERRINNSKYISPEFVEYLILPEETSTLSPTAVKEVVKGSGGVVLLSSEQTMEVRVKDGKPYVTVEGCHLPRVPGRGILGSFCGHNGTTTKQVIIYNWKSGQFGQAAESLQTTYPSGIHYDINGFSTRENSFYIESQEETPFRTFYLLLDYRPDALPLLAPPEKKKKKKEACAVGLKMTHQRYLDLFKVPEKTPDIILMFYAIYQGETRKFIFKQNCNTSSSGICRPLYQCASGPRMRYKKELISHLESSNTVEFEITFTIQPGMASSTGDEVTIFQQAYQTTLFDDPEIMKLFPGKQSKAPGNGQAFVFSFPL
eukprot:GHVS01033115.1.p1 GENE.GHVS01033115.1~~GHVS01033115.1.p1  ORF type:complete len:442 (+),score=45.54 GHVS01033115.1:119-1444(+)